MEFRIHFYAHNILILGAGASMEYGLPNWDQLAELIKEKISNDHEGKYTHKEEMLEWVKDVGRENKKYTTIDECISQESVVGPHSDQGHHIENQIFLVIKDVFNERYLQNSTGWIEQLNKKILTDRVNKPEQKMVFINYNYDQVLLNHFLNFSYLKPKQREYLHGKSLSELSDFIAGAFYPHGSLYSRKELNSTLHISRTIDTIKTNNKNGHLDAVSCHDSEPHSIITDSFKTPRNLFLLGLGGGLELNLKKLTFKFPISSIHVTVKDKKKLEEVLKILSERFTIPPSQITVYDSCEDLIQKCF